MENSYQNNAMLYIKRKAQVLALRLFGTSLLSTCEATVTMEPIVSVQQGKLKGTVKKNLDGSSYYSFKGIPYAEPPVGELRFVAPLPPKSWTGIRNASEHGPLCPQFDITTSQTMEGNEDCLYLNVYTKTLNPQSKIPVMVYIHGGAYMSGSGDSDVYGPEYLFQHNVLLITLNYRLEVLGFLCLDTPEVPGNAGLKDQVMALKWIKANVVKFGGDPDNITLMGESAGATGIMYHMLSPMSKGLFHKVIAQSGTLLCDWSRSAGGKERAFKVGKFLGKDTNNVEELLQFLRTVPALNLTKVTTKIMTEDEKYRGLPIQFSPTLEKKFDKVEAFMTENPIELMLSKNLTSVPIILGYNSAEGMLMLRDQLKKSDIYNSKPAYWIPKEIAIKVNKNTLKDFGDRVKRFYVGDKSLGIDTAQSIINMQTDIHFMYNTHRFAYFYSVINPATYMYRFDYESDMNAVKMGLGLADMKGACHADDLFYLFYNEFNKESYESQPKLRKIVYELTKLWTDFARTGNPTPDHSLGVSWQPFTQKNKEYLALNEELTSDTFAEKDRVLFWNTLYCEAGLPAIGISKSNL